MKRVQIEIADYYGFTLIFYMQDEQISLVARYLESKLGKARNSYRPDTDGRWIIRANGILAGFGDIDKGSDVPTSTILESQIIKLLKMHQSKEDQEFTAGWVKQQIAILKKLL